MKYYHLKQKKSIYGTELTRNDLTSSFSVYIDATVHEKLAKSFGEPTIVYNGLVADFTDEELDDILDYVQYYVKNVYSPSFEGVNFEDKPDFVERLMQDIY